MNRLKFILIILTLLTFTFHFTLYAEDLSLVDSCNKEGISVYYDCLTNYITLEKTDYTVTLKEAMPYMTINSDELVAITPLIVKDGQLKVSDSTFTLIKNALNGIKAEEKDKKAVGKTDKSENKGKEEDGKGFKISCILLDPGHGGKDPGAFGTFNIDGKKTKVKEKDVVLKIGLNLYEDLKKLYPDKKIVLTRDKDVYLTLDARTEIANNIKLNKNEAVMYVSLHANASLDKKAAGYEVWYLSPGYRRTVIDKERADNDESLFPILNSMMEEEYTTESILMSKFIMDGLQAQIGGVTKARGIKAEEWFVVKHSNMPATLIEVGFVTNEAEAKRLNTSSYLKKVSKGVYNGIVSFVTHFEHSRGFTK